MKKWILAIVSLTVCISITAQAAVRKNVPKTKEVKEQLKEAGIEHNPLKMKITKAGTSKVKGDDREDSYYHIFQGFLRTGEIRILICDNEKNYLGYYDTPIELTDVEEGQMLFDLGGGEEGGDYEEVQLPYDGPLETITINSQRVTFIKPPKKEGEEEAEATKKKSVDELIEAAKKKAETMRTWTIRHGGRSLSVRAMFIKKEGDTVILKSEAKGKEGKFKLNTLSSSDKKFIQELEDANQQD